MPCLPLHFYTSEDETQFKKILLPPTENVLKDLNQFLFDDDKPSAAHVSDLIVKYYNIVDGLTEEMKKKVKTRIPQNRKFECKCKTAINKLQFEAQMRLFPTTQALNRAKECLGDSTTVSYNIVYHFKDAIAKLFFVIHITESY